MHAGGGAVRPRWTVRTAASLDPRRDMPLASPPGREGAWNKFSVLTAVGEGPARLEGITHRTGTHHRGVSGWLVRRQLVVLVHFGVAIGNGEGGNSMLAAGAASMPAACVLRGAARTCERHAFSVHPERARAVPWRGGTVPRV